jgi:hypothetical protein
MLLVFESPLLLRSLFSNHLSSRERSQAKRRVRVSDVRLKQADPHPSLLPRAEGTGPRRTTAAERPTHHVRSGRSDQDPLPREGEGWGRQLGASVNEPSCRALRISFSRRPTRRAVGPSQRSVHLRILGILRQALLAGRRFRTPHRGHSRFSRIGSCSRRCGTRCAN